MVDPGPLVQDVLAGVAASEGVGVGPAMVVQTARKRVEQRPIAARAVGDEIGRFDRAVQALLSELARSGEDLAQRAELEAAAAAVALITSHKAVLADPLLIDAVHRHIRVHLRNAEWALECVIDELRNAMFALDNPGLRDWWRDVDALANTLQERLGGRRALRGFPAGVGVVAVAESLGIGDAIELIQAGGAGVVLERGSITSHVGVLCRSSGIPAVVGVADACSRLRSGATVVVDGDAGRVWHQERPLAPGAAIAGQADDDDRPLMTACGTPIVLRANLALNLSAAQARRFGTRGVGLMRTFYQYVGRTALPSEDELAALYSGVVADFAPEPVTIRLVDLGGSFNAEQLPVELLGVRDCRGIRLFRERPEVIRCQLRALCRASCHGRLRVLVPFCTDVDEVRTLRDELQQAADAVRKRGHTIAPMEVGAMIEVPSAVLLSDAFTRECDFMAIGTNDLASYLLAQSREDPDHDALASAQPLRLHRALAAAIEMVTASGRAHRKPVTLCGELASAPEVVPKLLATGLRELSVAPRLAPRVRAAIRLTDLRHVQ